MTEFNDPKLVDCKYCESTGRIYEPNHMGNLEISGNHKNIPAT